MKIVTLHSPHGRPLRDGEPCGHPGCLSHVSHPCEGCGRVGGRTALSDIYVESCGKCHKTPEEHYKDKQGQLWCVGNVNEMYEPVPIYYPAECKHGKKLIDAVKSHLRDQGTK